MSLKIGIVDDDQGSVRALTEYAVTLGYEVAAAYDGEEGYELFLKERPDILLLDGLLPKLHGFDLCKKIKARPEGRNMPVLLISGVYKGHKYRTQASSEFAADGYFEKPLDIRKLFDRIGDLTGNRAESVGTFQDQNRRFKRLKEETLPLLLYKLYDEEKTGTLFLELDHVRKSIFFKQGYISFAVSNQKHERLGDMLLAGQKISLKQFQEISLSMKETGKRFGILLLESGCIDALTLEAYLQRQLENIVYDIFTWTNGYYDFVTTEADEEFITLKTTPAQIILRGIEKAYTLEILERRFPGNDTIFILSQNPRYRFQTLQLEEKEEKIISLLDGTHSVDAVIRELDLTSVEVRKFLYGLFVSRVIEKKDEGAKVEEEKLFSEGEEDHPLDEDLRKSILQKYIQVQSQNAFEILEISRTRDKQVVKTAFLRLAKVYHPDRYFHRLDDKYNDYVKVIFQKINHTYQQLSEAFSLTAGGESKAPSFERKPETTVQDDNVTRAENFFEKGIELYGRGDREGAQNALISAIQVNPNEPEYHLHLGKIFLEDAEKNPNNLELAESALKYALRLSTRDARPFLYMGLVHKMRGDPTRSEEFFRKALERNPKYIEALREIRLFDARKKKGVKRIFKKIIGIS